MRAFNGAVQESTGKKETGLDAKDQFTILAIEGRTWDVCRGWFPFPSGQERRASGTQLRRWEMCPLQFRSEERAAISPCLGNLKMRDALIAGAKVIWGLNSVWPILPVWCETDSCLCKWVLWRGEMDFGRKRLEVSPGILRAWGNSCKHGAGQWGNHIKKASQEVKIFFLREGVTCTLYQAWGTWWRLTPASDNSKWSCFLKSPLPSYSWIRN